MRAVCILRCNIDSFLLNKKGLESMSILHKNFCNMHIARLNMHIAIESMGWESQLLQLTGRIAGKLLCSSRLAQPAVQGDFIINSTVCV
jgi:hypothetical protein